MIGISVSIEIGTAGGGGDSVAPTVTARTIDAAGTSLTLTFSEAVTGSTGFSLTASGGAVTPSYASGSGTSSYTFTLSRTIAQGETVTLSYTPGNVADGAGNALASITNAAVTNSSTQTPITLSSAVIGTSGTSLTLTFGAAVTGFSSGAEGFALTGLTGGATTLTYASGNGTTTVVMTISRTVAQSETNGALAYTAGDITAVATSVALANFSGTSVTNNSTQTAPTLSSAAIGTNGTSLTLTFSASVTGFASGAEGFALTGLSGGATTLTYASGNGTSSVVMTVSRTVSQGETGGSLAYTAGDITASGNGLSLANFSGTSVTNNSTVPAEPDTVSGMGLWLEDLYTSSLWEDSGFSTPATNGDPVGGWQDQAGSRNATSSSTARPIIRSGTASDGLQFDNSNDYLDLASALTLAASAHTVYVVYYWPAASYVGTALVDKTTETAKLGINQSGIGASLRLAYLNDDGSGSVNTSMGSPSAGYIVARWRKTTTTNVAVKAAGQTEANITVRNYACTLDRINIAGLAATNGRIRAIYAWPSKLLSAGETTTVEDWINYRYGVTP